MRANRILTEDQGRAIAAIQSLIQDLDQDTPRSKMFQKVIEKMQSGDIAFAEYDAEEGASYLGGQYTYVSKKSDVGEVTYFVGVKNDQPCIGIVSGNAVTELGEEGIANATARFNKKFEPIKSRANAVGRAVSNVGASLTKQSSTIFPRGLGDELDEENRDMVVGGAASEKISKKSTRLKSQSVAPDGVLEQNSSDLGDDLLEVGRVTTKYKSREEEVIASMRQRIPGTKKGPKRTDDQNANAAQAFLAIARSHDKLGKAPEGLKFVSGGDGKYEGFIYQNADGASVFVGFEISRGVLGTDKKMLFGAMQVSADGKITAVANDGSLAELKGKLPSELDEQVVEEDEEQSIELDEQQAAVDMLSSDKMENPFDLTYDDETVSNKSTPLDDTPDLDSPRIRQPYGRGVAPSQRYNQVSNSGPAPLRSKPSSLSAEALLPLRIRPLLEEIYGRLGEEETVAIGNITFTRITFTRTRTGDAVQFKIGNSTYLMDKEGVYSVSKILIETGLAEQVCGEIETQLSARVVEDDMFSADDQSPQPNQSRQPNSRTSRVRPEDEQRPPYVAPNTRLGSNIKTANPANSDTGRGGFFTSKSPIQELVDAMQDHENTAGLGEATLTAFKTVVAHFARRKENAGLPKGINYIDQGNVGSGGNYRAFHYHDYDGRDIVLGFKINASDMEMKLEPFFGSPMLKFGEITAIDEREHPKFLLALQRQLNSPFHRIAEVDNLTLKAVVSDLTVSNLKLDLGGGLNLAPVVRTDANNAKVAAVTKQGGAEYSIVVKKGLARVEEPKTLTFKTGSAKSASSDVATDVEGRCRTFLKKKRTLEWMKEVALGDHHPDYTITNGVDTTDEEIQKIAFKQAMYDAFKESLSTMDDKTSINEGLAVDVTDKRGGFSYSQGVVKKHFGIDENGHLLFLKQVPNQEWVVVQPEPEELREEDIDTLIEVMGFDKAKLKEVLVDKTQELEFERDNYELEEEQFHQRPKGNASRLTNSLPSLQHPNQRQGGGGAPRPTSFASNQQQGGRPSSAPSKPEAYQLKGELIQVISYEKGEEVNVKQRGSKLIKSIADPGKTKQEVGDSIAANAIVVAAAKNGLTPAQAIEIIRFSIVQRGFSNMRGFSGRIALAEQFAEYVSQMPGGRDDLDFLAMAKFSSDFQRETTKAGLKREDSEFEGKIDGLNSSDIPKGAIKRIIDRIDDGGLDQNNVFPQGTVSGATAAIQEAADKSSQSSYSR